MAIEDCLKTLTIAGIVLGAVCSLCMALATIVAGTWAMSQYWNSFNATCPTVAGFTMFYLVLAWLSCCHVGYNAKQTKGDQRWNVFCVTLVCNALCNLAIAIPYAVMFANPPAPCAAYIAARPLLQHAVLIEVIFAFMGGGISFVFCTMTCLAYVFGPGIMAAGRHRENAHAREIAELERARRQMNDDVSLEVHNVAAPAPAPAPGSEPAFALQRIDKPAGSGGGASADDATAKHPEASKVEEPPPPSFDTLEPPVYDDVVGHADPRVEVAGHQEPPPATGGSVASSSSSEE